MSNSLSNTLKIRDLAREFLPNAIKLYLLSKHYREDLPFPEPVLKNMFPLTSLSQSPSFQKMTLVVLVTVTRFLQKFQTCLDNDFDTQGALSILLEGITNGIDRTILSKMTDIFGLYY